MKVCTCTSYCRGAAGLADGLLCKQESPGEAAKLERAEIDLPPGQTCADCSHGNYCARLGFTTLTNVACEFAPSRFIERKAA